MTTVLLVDDQAVIRSGLRLIIESEPDLEVVGEAADGDEAIRETARLRPDVVLMDIRMPRLDGVQAALRIRQAPIAPAVVMVTTFDDEAYLLDSIRAGAAGFLLKDSSPALFVAGVRAAVSGDTLIDPSMTRAILERRLADDAASAPAGTTAAATALETLSPRERDVLGAVARGLSNAAIAAELWVSEATVKTHVASILAKTGSENRVQAVVLAYESGFVTPGS